MRAIWENKVIAESENTLVVEGNHYFPVDSVHKNFLKQSDMKTVCPWKGEASYYDVVVGEKKNENAAWYYPNPSKAADNIKDHVAFWMGVSVIV